jgi:hypothetical protein
MLTSSSSQHLGSNFSPALLEGLKRDPRMGPRRAAELDAMGLCRQSVQDTVWQVRPNHASFLVFGLGCT